jgi:cytoskeletal protein CcmA (bactofilin family)
MATTAVHPEPCVLGPQIAVRGTLVGEEDLVVEGRLEGSVSLSGHMTVAEAGVVEADVEVDSIEVHGEVQGDIAATRAITIQKGARVAGNVRAPRVMIHDGAHFEGSVDMQVELPDALAKSLSR